MDSKLQKGFLARGSGPGAQTRDGCSVELYKRSVYNGELDPLASILADSQSVLELGCGTGRLTRKLIEWGCSVLAVDNSKEMLSELPEEARRVHADIEGLSLGEVFDVALLASYIINTPDQSLRMSMIGAARRHLAADGVFLIHYQDPDLLRDVQPGRESKSNGITTRIESVAKTTDVVRIEISYRQEREVWIHEFDAAVLERGDISRELEFNGLKIDCWIDETNWVVARHR